MESTLKSKKVPKLTTFRKYDSTPQKFAECFFTFRQVYK